MKKISERWNMIWTKYWMLDRELKRQYAMWMLIGAACVALGLSWSIGWGVLGIAACVMSVYMAVSEIDAIDGEITELCGYVQSCKRGLGQKMINVANEYENYIMFASGSKKSFAGGIKSGEWYYFRCVKYRAGADAAYYIILSCRPKEQTKVRKKTQTRKEGDENNKRGRP